MGKNKKKQQIKKLNLISNQKVDEEKIFKEAIESELMTDVIKSRHQLEKDGYVLKEVYGDGNCLFRAISDQLYGKDDQHIQLRKKAVEFIKNNQDDFVFYMEDDKKIEDYIISMSKDGAWGGQLEMKALAECLKFNVIIHVVD